VGATALWREYFAGRYFRLAMPLLDDDVVELIRRVPSSLRQRKRVYTETVTAMYPRLFTVPTARSASYTTYWPAALKQQAAGLRGLVKRGPSLFDAIIPPSVLLALLTDDGASPTRFNEWQYAVLKRAYGLLRKAGLHRTSLTRPTMFKSATSTLAFLQ